MGGWKADQKQENQQLQGNQQTEWKSNKKINKKTNEKINKRINEKANEEIIFNTNNIDGIITNKQRR